MTVVGRDQSTRRRRWRHSKAVRSPARPSKLLDREAHTLASASCFLYASIYTYTQVLTQKQTRPLSTHVSTTRKNSDRSCLGIESTCRTSRSAWSSFISTTCTHTRAFSSNADENRTEVAHRGSHTSDKGRRTRKAARALILTRIQSHTSAALAFCSAAICAATACTRHQFSGPHKDRDGSAG